VFPQFSVAESIKQGRRARGGDHARLLFVTELSEVSLVRRAQVAKDQCPNCGQSGTGGRPCSFRSNPKCVIEALAEGTGWGNRVPAGWVLAQNLGKSPSMARWWPNE